jgi:hypothetical protein
MTKRQDDRHNLTGYLPANFTWSWKTWLKQTHTLLPYISHAAPFVELRQAIPSQIQAISPFVDQLMQFIAKSRSMDESATEIEIALTEALEKYER